MRSEVDFVIIGAGAAGISAAKALQESGRSYVVLEASHRIGGRAHTEELRPGEYFDLGAHWIHSSSLNPFTQIARDLGATAVEDGDYMFIDQGRKLSEEELEDFNVFTARQHAAMKLAVATGTDVSVYDATDRDHKWTPYFDYIFVTEYTADVDQVSVKDFFSYIDRDEDLALRNGFGTLLSRFGADLPITLNSAVQKIDWSGPGVRLTSPRGTLRAKAVIITVSTGILGSGDLQLTPELPLWKQEAVSALPLGNSNRICLGFDENVFDVGTHTHITVNERDDEPVEMTVRPFGYNYVEFITGGRFADWLEKAGDAAAVDYATRKVQAVFGSKTATHVDGYITSAWRGDAWVRGTYSYAIPGGAEQRARLAEPIDKKLYFAGEATSTEFFSTVHGAYFTGIAVVTQVLRDHPA